MKQQLGCCLNLATFISCVKQGVCILCNLNRGTPLLGRVNIITYLEKFELFLTTDLRQE